MFGLKDRFQIQMLAFCLVFQTNRSKLEMQHLALVKQWLGVQLSVLQVAPRPGTPGGIACYCNYPLSLDLEMPREQREQLQRLETFESASFLSGVC